MTDHCFNHNWISWSQFLSLISSAQRVRNFFLAILGIFYVHFHQERKIMCEKKKCCVLWFNRPIAKLLKKSLFIFQETLKLKIFQCAFYLTFFSGSIRKSAYLSLLLFIIVWAHIFVLIQPEHFNNFFNKMRTQAPLAQKYKSQFQYNQKSKNKKICQLFFFFFSPMGYMLDWKIISTIDSRWILIKVWFIPLGA